MTESKAGTSAPRSESAPKTLIEAAFPTHATQVFYAAIAVGLALVVVSLQTFLPIGLLQSNLLLCVGVALVLAAFGGQANIRAGRIIVVGVAAIAIILFIVVKRDSDREFISGEVSNVNYKRFKEVHLWNEHELRTVPRPNSINLQRSTLSFLIFRSELTKNHIDVSFVDHNNEESQPPLSIPIAKLQWAFARRELLEWDLRTKKVDNDETLEIFDRVKGERVSEPPQQTALSDPHFRFPSLPAIVSSALAQDGESMKRIDTLLDQLKSDDFSIRRTAREALAQLGEEAVPRMMQRFRTDFDDYRTRLGVCFALDQMLVGGNQRTSTIPPKLSDEDIRLLIKSAGDPDKTIRAYATQFLSHLEDGRTTKMAIVEAADTTNEIARYNSIFISIRGWPKLTVDERKELQGAVNRAKERSSPQTRELMTKLKG